MIHYSLSVNIKDRHWWLNSLTAINEYFTIHLETNPLQTKVYTCTAEYEYFTCTAEYKYFTALWWAILFSMVSVIKSVTRFLNGSRCTENLTPWEDGLHFLPPSSESDEGKKINEWMPGTNRDLYSQVMWTMPSQPSMLAIIRSGSELKANLDTTAVMLTDIIEFSYFQTYNMWEGDFLLSLLLFITLIPNWNDFLIFVICNI